MLVPIQDDCPVVRKKIKEIFSKYKGIRKWKIDFKHPYKMLQVEGYGITAQEIITAISEAGYDCKEL